MISRAVYDLLKTVAESKLLHVNPDTNLKIFLKNEIYEYETKGADALVFYTMLLAQEIFEDCGNAKDTIERLANSLEPHGVDWNMLGQELSLSRMQEIGQYFVENAEKMNREMGLRTPAVPFGYKNSTWEWMMREYQEGDKFYSYATKRKNEDKNYPIQTGYCMVRSNKIISVLTTMRS